MGFYQTPFRCGGVRSFFSFFFFLPPFFHQENISFVKGNKKENKNKEKKKKKALSFFFIFDLPVMLLIAVKNVLLVHVYGTKRRTGAHQASYIISQPDIVSTLSPCSSESTNHGGVSDCFCVFYYL